MDLIDLIFPRKCFGCGREGAYICPKCLSNARLVRPICPTCGKPSVDGMTHANCVRPLGLDGLVAFWKYDGAIRKSILSLKYQFAFDIVQELGQHLLMALQADFNPLPKQALLVPIPIYKDRENWRGFNQAKEIGKILADALGWELTPDLLTKMVRTQPQTELARKERLKNLRGVFSLNPHYPLPINHQSLILFDDVWTTGSTLKEATKSLKRRGFNEVWGLTLARG